jgi:hypothetical protein
VGSSGQRGLKGAVKAAIFALLRGSGAAFLTRHVVQSRRVTILAYHDPDAALFERHLSLLTSLYTVIPLERFLSARRGGHSSSLSTTAGRAMPGCSPPCSAMRSVRRCS